MEGLIFGLLWYILYVFQSQYKITSFGGSKAVVSEILII